MRTKVLSESRQQVENYPSNTLLHGTKLNCATSGARMLPRTDLIDTCSITALFKTMSYIQPLTEELLTDRSSNEYEMKVVFRVQ